MSKDCNKNGQRRVTARASVRQRLIDEGVMDKYNTPLDINSISKKASVYEASAFKRFGIAEKLLTFSEGYKRVIFNDEAFRKIDAAKGIFYKENKHLKSYGNLKQKEIETLKKENPSKADTDLFDKMYEASNSWVYNGEVFPSRADMEYAMQEDFSFMPQSQDYIPTNYANLLIFKEMKLKKLEKRIADAQAERKFNNTPEVKELIASLNFRKGTLESEIYDLKNATESFESAMAIFNNDLSFIDSILSNDMPSLEELQYVEEMITYFDIISDYSINNKSNELVNTEDPNLIEPEVKEALDKLASKVLEHKTALFKAKEKYLIQTINQSEKIKSMFPNQEAEEIINELLRERKDIDLISMLFNTVDKDFLGNDSPLAQMIREELEKSRSKEKSRAATFIRRITEIQPKVKAKLIQMGYGISYGAVNKIAGEVSYDIFYQKTKNGNKTGRLVGTYSDTWFKNLFTFLRNNTSEYNQARVEKDWEKANLVLAKKFDWINDNADFIDLGSIPEIVNNPAFGYFSKHFSNASEASAYKKQLIDTIGEVEYEKIVAKQTELLEDFIHFILNEQEVIKNTHGVSSMKDLPENVINSYNITVKRHDPFEMMKNFKQGEKGTVTHNYNKVEGKYQSHLKFNTFVPKKEITTVDIISGVTQTYESNYFDKDFETISKDKDLLEMWKVFSESAEYMNSALADSNTQLSHNSLLSMEKSFMDILFNKEMGGLSKLSRVGKETGQTLRDLVSTKERKESASNLLEVNKNNINTIDSKVKPEVERIRMELSTNLEKIVEYNSIVDLDKISPKAKEDFFNSLGIEEGVFESTFGREFPFGKTVREIVTDNTMNEQAFNLPLMMRAYLDTVSEYKAQKDSLGKITLFKGLYDNVKKNSTEHSVKTPIRKLALDIKKRIGLSGVTDQRVQSLVRMENWVNKQVKGAEDPEFWIKFSKNYTKEESDFKKEAEKYLELLNKRIEEAVKDEDVESLLAEKTSIEAQLDSIGRIYNLGAFYNSVINRLSIFVGLGFSVTAPVFNRFQGFWSGMINDTGRYWTAGNFYEANAFINRKGLRYIPGMKSYKQEMRKTKLMMEKLNIIQDATNEMDRARRESGLTGVAKVLSPFYLTEYTEWHNQTPQILSMLMDYKIKSKDGSKEVQIFDGNSFPAFSIENGQLVLKEEFATEENIATWQYFSNESSAENKSKMSSTIALLNGDYSKTGSTLIKSKHVGKTLMMYKTWFANQMFIRFAKEQRSASLGSESFEGAYIGGLRNKKTRVAATAGLVTGIGVSTLVGLPLVAGGIIAGGLISYQGIQSFRKRKVDGENMEALRQLSYMGKSVVKKFIGIPINTVSGKNIIKQAEAGNLQISDKDIQNLQFIINEVTGLLWLTLFKLMIKSALSDDDEEEPKTLDGKQQNPYYYTNIKNEEQEKWYNLAENIITRLINESTLYINPNGLWETVKTPAGIDNWFNRVVEVSDGIIRKINGNDTLSSGPNAGESKLFNSLERTFIPGVFKEFTSGNFKDLGFETYKRREWDKNEIMDNWFQSDYKKDRKALKSEKAARKKELTDYWNSELQVDKEKDPAVKIELENIVNKLVKEELDATFNTDFMRLNYDEEQNKIE